ncbi:unnamed protein product [Lupinus luteus]|uniref:Uncharacterized protein n=1 Tax=Lupinus luteus TaxID=3873 RepID=A0AAV1XT65_LUPLU
MNINNIPFLTFFFTFFTISSFSLASLPQPNHSFNPNKNQGGTCSYTVTIKTSCSSPSKTKDQIALAFGDAYGHQVYAPRLDDPYSKTFERCSTDTFKIKGQCTNPICYLYLYRTGYDGWVPEYVTVSSHNYKPVTFYYNTGVPHGVWFGFNNCHGSSTLTM